MKSISVTPHILISLVLGSVLLTQSSYSVAGGPADQAVAPNIDISAPLDNAQTDNLATAASATSKAEEQRQLALSKRPPIVGVEILQQEAEGLRNLPDEAVQSWRMGRLIPEI